MANTHENLASLFTDIADSIRAKTGSAEGIIADNFPEEIAAIDTQEDLDPELATQDDLIAQIAMALEGKTGAGTATEVTYGTLTLSSSDANSYNFVLPVEARKENVILSFLSERQSTTTTKACITYVSIRNGTDIRLGICLYNGYEAVPLEATAEGAATYDISTGTIAFQGVYEYFCEGLYEYFAW